MSANVIAKIVLHVMPVRMLCAAMGMLTSSMAIAQGDAQGAMGGVVAAVDASDAKPGSETPHETPEASQAIESPSVAPENGSASEGEESKIDEIVVTAQRREQNLQDVPISVSAITADSLQEMGIQSTSDLTSIAAGLQIHRQTGAVMPYIRGIGNPNSSGGQESPVALYIDGFYMPQLTSLNFSFNNIERVEVLKGPQGTLFGRNATGGLIQVVTRDPRVEKSFKADVSYGNYDTKQAAVYATSGIAEGLTADLAAIGIDQGKGFGENVVTGKDVNKERSGGLRSTWLYVPSEATRIRLSLDYVDIKSSIGISRQAMEGTRTVDGQGPTGDFWNVRSDFQPGYTFEGSGVGLKLSHDFEKLQLVSLTGYRKGEAHNRFDQDGSPITLINAKLADDNRSLSQELQILSNADSKLNWIVGLYYLQYDVDYLVDLSGAALQAVGGSTIQESDFDTESYSAYAQGSYPLSDATNLTLGLRYTEDRRKFDGETRLPSSGTIVPSPTDPTQNASEPTWRIAVDHRFSTEMMGYLSYNRGFKSGVYNTVNIDQPPVKPETVDAYELGLKMDLFDRRLRWNAAAFYYDYQDLQVQILEAGRSILRNAAKAEIYGAESEISVLPKDNLELAIGLAYLHATYDSFPSAQITAPKPSPAGGNFTCTGVQPDPVTGVCPAVPPGTTPRGASGNDLIHAPRFAGSFTARYVIETGFGQVSLVGSYSYNGKFYWEADNRQKQDAYGLLNAQIDWTHPSERYRVYVFGKNLTDEEYALAFSGGSTGDVVAAQAPFTFGIGGEVRFE